MDFVIWSESSDEFAVQMKLCYKFITGKDLEVDVKKKTIRLKEEKKISIWSKIGRIFKIS
jgi:hypothetical protein